MGDVRIAAVQHSVKLGKNEENRARVTPLIEEAASKEAQLVALPEMAISGYSLHKDTWMHSEPINGPTEKWLQETARRLGIYLCAGLLQNEGSNFYNTYLVADPEGETIGRVRKTQTEFSIHKPGALEAHIVHTSFGSMGVGICADNHKAFFLDYMRRQDIDLMLQPHASFTPFKVEGLVNEQDIVDGEEKIKNFPTMCAEILGVPTVFINQSGNLEGKPWQGLIGRMIDLSIWRYPGCTSIVEPDKIISRMGDEEGVIVSDVPLNKVKSNTDIPDYNGWVEPGSALFRNVIMPIDIAWGKLSYNLSLSQRRKLTQ